MENTVFGKFEAVGSLIVEINNIFVFRTEQSLATDLLLCFLLKLFSSLYIIHHDYSHKGLQSCKDDEEAKGNDYCHRFI